MIGGILVLFIYVTRLASNEIFSPSNKIHREVGRTKDLWAPLHYNTFILQYNCLVAIVPATSVIHILRKNFIRRHSAIRTVFDDASDIAHLISANFCMIKNGMHILMSVYNKTHGSNSGVLAYKVIPLMLVVVLTKTRRNVDWLCENFRIIRCVVLTVGNLYTDTVGYAGTNVIDSRTSFVIASVRSSIHWNICI
jgi:hypothetical protein